VTVDDGTVTPAYALRVLRASTTLLAGTPAEQLQFYGTRVAVADELVSDFDYAMDLLWCLEDASLVTPAIKDALERVSALIDQMGALEDEELWTPDALTHRREWTDLRAAAAAAIPLIEAIHLPGDAE
jgi:hypothetical protein